MKKKLLNCLYVYVFLLASLVFPLAGIVTASEPLSVVIHTGTDGTISIEGQAAPVANKQVTVKVMNPDGTLNYLNQTVADEAGKFSFQYRLQQAQPGAYNVQVNTESEQTSWQGTFAASSENSGVSGGEGARGGQSSGNGEIATCPAPGANGMEPVVIPQLIVSEANGKTTVTAQLSQAQWEEALKQQMGPDRRTITFALCGQSADEAVLRIPLGAISALPDQLRRNGSVIVATELGGYTLPFSSLNWQELNQRVGNHAGELQLEIRIAKADDAVKAKIVSHATAMNASIEGGIVSFNIAVSDGANRFPVEAFTAYVDNSMTLAKYIDPWAGTAVYYDAEANRLRFVPSTFAADGDKQAVTIKSRGNAVIAIISGQRSFNDLAGVSWAEASITQLAAKRIVNGVGGDSRFEPQRNVTRAEMAELLVNALGLKRGDVAQRSTFADVPAVAWYADAVNTAVRNGLVEGHNSLFRPNDRITRQELAVMVIRAAQFAGKSVEVVDAKGLGKYRDADTVADWARREMALAVNWGIVSGTALDRIEADGPATRAQAAVMLERMLCLIGFINER